MRGLLPEPEPEPEPGRLQVVARVPEQQHVARVPEQLQRELVPERQRAEQQLRHRSLRQLRLLLPLCNCQRSCRFPILQF